MRTDHLLHLLVSAVIMAVLSYFLPAPWAFCITLLIGIGKEVYDKVSKKGTAELSDLFFDFLGAFGMGVIGQLATLL